MNPPLLDMWWYDRNINYPYSARLPVCPLLRPTISATEIRSFLPHPICFLHSDQGLVNTELSRQKKYLRKRWHWSWEDMSLSRLAWVFGTPSLGYQSQRRQPKSNTARSFVLCGDALPAIFDTNVGIHLLAFGRQKRITGNVCICFVSFPFRTKWYHAP